jgi:hypothetical protein
MIATICSSVKRTLRIAPSESGASLSTYRWAENPGAGHSRVYTSVYWWEYHQPRLLIFSFCACWVFGDALLATTAKSASRGFCCNVPSRTLTLRNPLGGEARLGDLLFYSVLSNANIQSQVNRL